MSPSIRTMGFFMSEINFCNTKEQLNHLGEVVTGKVGGSPSGADIETSTLSYTGQVRKTLPALEGEYEQSITNKEAEADAVIDTYRLLNKGPYSAGISLDSKFEYITYNGESYFAANPPYTTTATTPDADGNLFVGGYVNESQASSISETVLEQNISTYTNIAYSASGGNSAIENMIAGVPIPAKIGDSCSTGGTNWKVKSSSSIIDTNNTVDLGGGLVAVPENSIYITDCGALFDWNGVSGTDDTDAFDYALSNFTDLKMPPRRTRITRTIRTSTGTSLKGSGVSTSIYLDNVSGPGILTYSGLGEGTTPNQDIGDFCITGACETGIAFAHCTVSSFSNIYCEEPLSLGYTNTNRLEASLYCFDFEYFWGSTFKSLYTNGASSGLADFHVGGVVLASNFTSLYTSNVSPYNMLSTNDTPYSTGSGVGKSRNTFTNLTLQGGRIYGLAWRSGSESTFTECYTEASNGVHISAGTQIKYQGDIGKRSQEVYSDHSLYLGRYSDGLTSSVQTFTISNTRFSGDILSTLPVIIGRGMWSAGSSFRDNHIIGQTIDVHNGVKATSTSSGDLPVSFQSPNGGGTLGSNTAQFVMRTQAFGREFVALNPKSDGTWSANTWTPDLVDIAPRTHATPEEFQDISSDINVFDKAQNRNVFDLTDRRFLFNNGTSASSGWYTEPDGGGVLVYTPS